MLGMLGGREYNSRKELKLNSRRILKFHLYLYDCVRKIMDKKVPDITEEKENESRDIRTKRRN